MERTTWHVDIELADSGSEVTACARLRTGSEPAAPGIGLGTVRHDEVDGDPNPALVLAARRSLADLESTFDYLRERDHYGQLDQA